MKRKNNLYNNMLNYDNLLEVFQTVSKNSKNKNEIFNFSLTLNINLLYILELLKKEKYKFSKYYIFLIREPKYRIIMSERIYDKIVNHLVSKYVLIPALDSCLIDTNVATRKNKGSIYAFEKFKNYISKIGYNKKIYVLKIDINKYFYNIADIQLTGEHKPGWETTCNEEKNTIGCTLLKDNTAKEVPNNLYTTLSASSENGSQQGLYKTKVKDKNIYFFRGGDYCDSNGTVTETAQGSCDSANWKTLKNNLIFADKCWQIIRTNEDGSVRVIFNGVPTNGKCTASGTDTQLGSDGAIGGTDAYNTSYKFNDTSYSLYGDASAVGYTLGNPVDKTYKDFKGLTTVTSTDSSHLLSTDILISKTYTFNSTTGIYTLVNPVAVSTIQQSEIGTDADQYKYTFQSTTATSGTYLREFDSWVDTSTKQFNWYFHIGHWSEKEEEATSSEIDSRIKTHLDAWYESNLSNQVGNYIIDAGFCNDRTVYDALGYGVARTVDNSNNAYYASRVRLFVNKTPSLICSNSSRDLYTVSSSNGNRYLTYPIGLITGDEIAMAGGVAGEVSYTTPSLTSNFYLYTGSTYWTMTPYSINRLGWLRAMNIIMQSTRQLTKESVSNSYGIRPVISLKDTIQIIDGDGSKDDPYILNLT